jgi:hypothetical protein
VASSPFARPHTPACGVAVSPVEDPSMLISHRSRVPVARSSVVAASRRLLLSADAGLAVGVTRRALN